MERASKSPSRSRWTFWILFTLFCVAFARQGLNFYIDYPMYDRAGTKVLSGEVSDLNELTRTEAPKYHYSYFFALLFSPLSMIGPKVGRGIFLTLLCLAYLFLVRSSCRLAAVAVGRPNDERLVFLTAVAAIFLTILPVGDAFMTANIALFLAALCQLAFLFRERPWLSGVFLGAAITIKIYPLMLLGYFVWSRNARVVAATMAWTAIFYWGLPALLVGAPMATHLLHTQNDALSRFGNHWPYDAIMFQNITATAMRWTHAPRAFGVALATSLLCFAAFFSKSFFRQPPNEEFRYRMYVFAMACVPLLLPISWYNVAIFYLPLLAHSVALAFQKAPLPRVGLGIFIALYCLTTNDLWGKHLNDQMELYSIPFLGAFGLVAFYAMDTVSRYPDQFYLPSLRKALS